MIGKNREVEIDGKKYNTSDLTDNAEKIINNLSLLEVSNQEKANMVAVLTKAKRAYITELKNEMLNAKSGLNFSD